MANVATTIITSSFKLCDKYDHVIFSCNLVFHCQELYELDNIVKVCVDL